MLGTLIGDIIGSAYEFSHFKGKDFAPLFHAKARFTDDTVCTVAVADALVRGADPQATMIDWCKRYAEKGGWGKQFAFWFLAPMASANSPTRGHPKFPQAAQSDYDVSGWMANRAAASLSL